MGVKVNSGKYTIASHSITRYGEFLAQSIQTYCTILEDMQTHGYSSEAVSASLQNIQSQLSDTGRNIMDACESLNRQTEEFLRSMDSVSNEFSFPYNRDDKVSRFFHIHF